MADDEKTETKKAIPPPAMEAAIEEHEAKLLEQVATLAGVSRDGAASCMAAARIAKRWGAGHRMTEANYLAGVLDASKIALR